MPAKIINGKKIADAIREKLTREVSGMNIKPHVAVVQVGLRKDSSQYVSMKLKQAEMIGIKVTHEVLPASINEQDLLARIGDLNDDDRVHGILVQLPLPDHINPLHITEKVDFRKDVDGFHSSNTGLLVNRNAKPHFEPCTPKGIMRLLKEECVDLAGKRAVVVGRSNIVGLPISFMLQNANATVTLCHSKTQNLSDIVSTADILVVAIGAPNMIKGQWIKTGAIVIDVGTNAVEDSSKKSGFRWVGDVDFQSANEVAQAITPVPGGVGPM